MLRLLEHRGSRRAPGSPGLAWSTWRWSSWHGEARFHAGHSDVAEIETAYKTLTPLLGPAAAGAFLTALLASGLASSTVGTMAGQMIMQGASPSSSECPSSFAAW